MREIKFRAWVKEVFEKGEFAYGGYMIEPRLIKSIKTSGVSSLADGPRGTGIEYFEQGSFLPGWGSLHRLRFDEIELMQHTGLKDKNGVEIYEGDILSNGQHIDWIVFYDEASFKVKHRGAITRDSWVLSRGMAESREVIGNIHEHPYLLKEAQNANDY